MICDSRKKVKRTHKLIGRRKDFVSAAALGLLAKYKADNK